MPDIMRNCQIIDTTTIDIPDWIYQMYLDAGNTMSSSWVRLLIAHDRQKGRAGGLIFSEPKQILVWNGTDVSWDNLQTNAQVTWPIDDFFEDEVPGPWTRAVIIIDATGDRSCTLYLVQDDSHLPTVDYIEWRHDPFWNHADEHQDELVAIARQVYGTDTGTTH